MQPRGLLRAGTIAMVGLAAALTAANAARIDEPCIVDENATGTVNLPPDGCDYLSPTDVHMIIEGLPKEPPTTIELDPIHTAFICPTGVCGDGNPLDGDVEVFTSTLVMTLKGTGDLDGFRRILRIPAEVETHTGARPPGNAVFATDMYSLQGSLTPEDNDPDFASLTITAGTSHVLPSPGQTTLTELADGTFQVDSFFDIAYRIDFEIASGGSLDRPGFTAGTTTGTLRMTARAGRQPAIEPDNGTGTVTLPPEGSQYVTPRELHNMIDEVDPGKTIAIDPIHWNFFCENAPCGQPGGTLGGEREVFNSTLELELTGTGDLDGYSRQLTIPNVLVETHTGPRFGVIYRGTSAAGPAQSFPTDLYSLMGTLEGDPEFTQLIITAGTGNALPSPGHTTLTDLGNGTFQVDSFFDVTYQIQFQGAPGTSLAEFSGMTSGTVRVNACDAPNHQARNITIAEQAYPDYPNNFSFTGALGAFSLDTDEPDPTLPSRRRFFNLIPGAYMVTQTADPDWTLIRIRCEGDEDKGTTADLTTEQVTIDLDLGDSITCTFTNVPTADFIFADGFESGNVSAWSGSVP